MLKLKKFIGFAIIVLMAANSWSADKLALTMKTKGDVKVTVATSGSQEKLNRGTSLFDGDRIKTGTDGNVVILFLDDKTQLKLKGNSETEITGTRGKDGISKRINMAYGSVKASVSKQKGEFIISTPTSVASVKGTEYWIISDPDSGDILINISGTVELTNVYTGEMMVVEAGVVMLSTPDGEIKILKLVRIIGDAVADPSGGQFGLSGIIILEGEAESGDLSGLIIFDENTIFEGAEVTAGKKVNVLGVLDTDDGNVYATLIEISEPINIEALATSSLSNEEFTIGDVVLISGETESLPTKVKITENTSVEGDDVVAGAQVTVSGNYNEETGVMEATALVVVIPELKITGRISSITSDTEFEITGIVVVDGNADPSALSGVVALVEGATVEGGDLVVGAKVTVTGMLDEGTGAINANRVVISQVVIAAIATTGIENNQFEIREISVLDGDVDPSTLSGVVITGENTDVDEGYLFPGVNITISGSVDEGTGDFLALEIIIPELELSGNVVTMVSDNEIEISDILLLAGEIDESLISGRIIIPESATVEGTEMIVGAKVTITGIFNVDDGSIIARRIGITQVTIEAVATSGVSNSQFEVRDISVLDGDADPSALSSVVKITGSTEVNENYIFPGVRMTIAGSIEGATGDFLALTVLIPELQVSGTVSNVISDGEIEISDIELLEGEADESALSGRIIIPEWASVEGADLETGAKVTVTGVLSEDDGSIIARQVVATLVTIEAIATGEIVNNQFEIETFSISVIDGDVDPSNLSGIVKVSITTVIEGGEVAADVQVTITGSVEEGTGDFLASRILVVVSDEAQKELLFELENNQGSRKELIIIIQ